MKILPIVLLISLSFVVASCSSSGSDPDTIPTPDMAGGDATADPDTPAVDSGNDPSTDAPGSEGEQPTPMTNDETEARYRITFDANWTSTTHPTQYPNGPHFSGLVGAIHNAQVIFWEPGQIATDGIELMAETGSKSIFLNEINESIASGATLAAINGPGIRPGDGQASVEVTVSLDYPEITVTTMLAPSPDWFAGLHNFPLHNGDAFIDTTTIDAVLYDSGTDSGVSYTSSNADTQPRDPIAPTSSEAQDSSFENGQRDDHWNY